MGARVRPLLAAVVGVLALAGCAAVPAASLLGDSGEFVRHPDAIEMLPSPVPGSHRTPRGLALVPVGDCVLGVNDFGDQPSLAGGFTNATANWVGATGCTHLELSPRPEETGDRLPSGALRVSSAVPAGDAAVVGVGSYPLAGDSEIVRRAPALMRREPDGAVHELARLPMHKFGKPPGPRESDIRPGTEAHGLVRMGQRLFVADGDVVDGRVAPAVWESADGGATPTELRLPPAPGDRPLTEWDQSRTPVPWWIATDGQTLLATASAATRSSSCGPGAPPTAAGPGRSPAHRRRRTCWASAG